MKMITAMIKPHKLDEVYEGLGRLGVAGLTVTDVMGFGHQKGHTQVYRGAEYTSNLLSKVKIDMATTDALAPKGSRPFTASPTPIRSVTAKSSCSILVQHICLKDADGEHLAGVCPAACSRSQATVSLMRNSMCSGIVAANEGR